MTVQGLRNFILHRDLPEILAKMSDTGSVDRLFPQVVTVTLCWLRLE
jgi:hypothetical protein